MWSFSIVNCIVLRNIKAESEIQKQNFWYTKRIPKSSVYYMCVYYTYVCTVWTYMYMCICLFVTLCVCMAICTYSSVCVCVCLRVHVK